MSDDEKVHRFGSHDTSDDGGEQSPRSPQPGGTASEYPFASSGQAGTTGPDGWPRTNQRSDDTEHTAIFGPYDPRPAPEPSPGHPLGSGLGSQVLVAPRRRSRNATAALLVAALLAGGLGGVAGAVGYDSLNDDGTVTSGDTVKAPLNTPATSSARSAPADGSPEAVATSVLPSVVKINVRGANGAGSGSGVIISTDGEVLTNNHVVDVAQDGGEISVNFNDGSTSPATVVGTDPVTDLAVIKAEGVSDLTAARIGDSAALRVGQGVVAIGSPFGLQATVTSGIVSSLNRAVSVGDQRTGGDTTYPAIQTDAAINPGNSGGPLVNLAGEVVGINSSIRSNTASPGGEGGSIGLGFAIPISKVLPIVEQLRNDQTPTHARLGVSVSDSQSNDGLVAGAGIESVEPGSSAAEAGIKSGDVVTRVDAEVIVSSESLVATIRGYRPGDVVEVTLLRKGEERTVTATLDSDVTTADS